MINIHQWAVLNTYLNKDVYSRYAVQTLVTDWECFCTMRSKLYEEMTEYDKKLLFSFELSKLDLAMFNSDIDLSFELLADIIFRKNLIDESRKTRNLICSPKEIGGAG